MSQIESDIRRWIKNAERRNATIGIDLASPFTVSPASLAAEMSQNFARIEAWTAVLANLPKN